MGYDLSNEEHEVDFERVAAETGLAWLLLFDNGYTVWFPKSRCYITPNDGGPGVLTAHAWLLDNNEIHYEL
jgi:hypothetical protein